VFVRKGLSVSSGPGGDSTTLDSGGNMRSVRALVDAGLYDLALLVLDVTSVSGERLCFNWAQLEALELV
jgi:hypothetical protein